MTLLIGVVAVAVVLGYSLGGRLRRLEELTVRWWPLAPVGLTMQLAQLPAAIDPKRGLTLGLLVASYVVLLTFVGANVRAPGFALLFVGLGLNLAVIAPNGGMPVSADALAGSDQTRTLALLQRGAGLKHHLMGEDDLLTPLADVIPFGPPFRQIVSVGDLVMYAGLGWTVVWAMRGRSKTSPVDLPPQVSLETGPYRGYRGKHRPYRHLPRAVRTSLPPPAAARSGI